MVGRGVPVLSSDINSSCNLDTDHFAISITLRLIVCHWRLKMKEDESVQERHKTSDNVRDSCCSFVHLHTVYLSLI